MVTDQEEQKDVIQHCFDSMYSGDYVSYLLTNIADKTIGIYGNPYITIELAENYMPIELGYFGERKVHFEDDTYTDKIKRIVEVSYEEFYEILIEQSNKYLQEHPDEKEQVEDLMQKIKARLNL